MSGSSFYNSVQTIAYIRTRNCVLYEQENCMAVQTHSNLLHTEILLTGRTLEKYKKENSKREALNLKNTSSITVKKTVGLNPKKPF